LGFVVFIRGSATGSVFKRVQGSYGITDISERLG
jgi:hypothetical protein